MFGLIKKVWSAIMNMFKVDGNLSIDTSNVYINGAKADLSVCAVSDSEYERLALEGACLSNVVYVVSSDCVNAYGQQLKNLAAPTDPDDAVTKEYVDAQVSSTRSVTREEVAMIAKDTLRSCLSGILSAI